jgi:hypothetical protein
LIRAYNLTIILTVVDTIEESNKPIVGKYSDTEVKAKVKGTFLANYSNRPG